MINIKQYADSISKMFKWNYTTVIRTHYKLKDHLMDKKVSKMVKTNKAPYYKFLLFGSPNLQNRNMQLLSWHPLMNISWKRKEVHESKNAPTKSN